MDSKLLLDVEVVVTNNNLFKILFDAEFKYCKAVYPCLLNSQIRGKALQMMGIRSNLKLNKLTKLIPFVYKRRILKPTEKWKIPFICSTFKPALILADRTCCLKIVTKTEYSLQFNLKIANGTDMDDSRNDIIASQPSISTMYNEDKFTSDKKFQEIFDRNGYEITEDSNASAIKTAFEPCIPSIHEPEENYHQQISQRKFSAKISESIATIEWPFSSKHSRKPDNDPNSHKSRTVLIDKNRRNFKATSQCYKAKRLKENLKPIGEEYFFNTVKNDAFRAMTITFNIHDDNHSTYSEDSLHMMTETEPGVLAAMFNPISKKRPIPVKPVIKITSSSQK